MSTPHLAPPEPSPGLKRWLLGDETHTIARADHPEREARRQHAWWRVMCLTGVDYFSTLGYQPGIAALAAGALSPIATLVLVVLTLVGALPMYRRVAAESPHGEGSIAMLEHLLSWWQGKLFILALLGFVATDFVITITLSAADASAHLLENPLAPAGLHGQRMAVTLALIGLLGAVFLKGFKEAIGIAVPLVTAYLALNAVVVAVGLAHLIQQPEAIVTWQRALVSEHGDPARMLLAALLVFPKLALGLSGFETGVAVMPLVQGAPGDTEARPGGRIHNTGKLLLVAGLLMSAFLVTSSLVTVALIPAEEFAPGGRASGRALAYLAHAYLGGWFGSAYDASTILILWFAGASAMAGLLQIVPRYLPRYGMAPEWARAARPLVLVFGGVAVAVTLLFRADVDAQGGAYATGVLVLMTSAAIAVMLAARRHGQARATIAFAAVALVFAYTTVLNVLERPEGVKIASLFITAIVLVSLISRAWRATEVRVSGVDLDPLAQRFVDEAARAGEVRLIAHASEARDVREYAQKKEEQLSRNGLPSDQPVLFLEVSVCDPSEFAPRLLVRGAEFGDYRVLRAQSATVPNAIAAFLLYLRDQTGQVPHAYFNWTEGNPLANVVRYLLFGQGDIAPLAHEVLREAERDPRRRPIIHVA